MEFEEFKQKILAELEEFCGADAKVELLDTIEMNGGRSCGIVIKEPGKGQIQINPVVSLDKVYQRFLQGMSLSCCAGLVVDAIAGFECPDEIKKVSFVIPEWDCVKDSVFPVLISKERNKQLLEQLISRDYLDMAVIYVLRYTLHGNGLFSVKITKEMVEEYGIAEEDIYRQAVKNLKQDGYTFCTATEWLLEKIVGKRAAPAEEVKPGAVYIMQNRSRIFGAAGILEKSFLKRTIRGQNGYIMPISVHTVAFVPEEGAEGQEALDFLMSEMRREVGDSAEELEEHTYFYDGKKEEVRICA